MIEYILIKDINDRDEHAHLLGILLEPRRQSILLNLIPYNPTAVEESFEAPTEEQVQSFFQICTSPQYRLFTRIRQEMGQDISGACGQLALVNPSKGTSDSSTKDIEDIAGSMSAKNPSNRKGKGNESSALKHTHDSSVTPSSYKTNHSKTEEKCRDKGTSLLSSPFTSAHMIVGTVVIVMIAIPLFHKLKFLR